MVLKNKIYYKWVKYDAQEENMILMGKTWCARKKYMTHL